MIICLTKNLIPFTVENFFNLLHYVSSQRITYQLHFLSKIFKLIAGFVHYNSQFL